MTSPESAAAGATTNADAANELLVRDDGPVRWIALNRPATRNGLTIDLNKALIAALESAAAPSVRVVVLTGEGGAFSSGLDLKTAASAMMEPAAISENLERYFHGLILAIRRLEKPVIALVDGPAAGFGCDLALACDLRIGTPRTKLGEIFVKRGLMPDGGGTYTLPRIVGLGRALEMMLTGDLCEGERAERIGLLNRLVADEAEALALAQRIAAGPPVVLRKIKESVYSALDGDLEAALATEARHQLHFLQSEDFFEGLSAFFQTPVEDHLKAMGISTIVICGTDFPASPRSTVYAAANRDFRLVLATDAISGATDAGLDEMAQIGAYLMATDRLLEWLPRNRAAA